MYNYKIFTINPGSTSTKIALFEGEKTLYSKNVSHDAEVLREFENIKDQFLYRKEMIERLLEENSIDLVDVDAFVGRGGGLIAMEGGTYEIDELLLEHSSKGANGVQHPANLGPVLAKDFANKYNKKAFVVNPPDVDELQDLARMTGIKGIYRTMHLHALNLKETAIRHAKLLGKKYEDCNFIVCHIGGGVSVSAHSKGRMIDGFDIVGGEGPMAPTRCGSISVANIVKYLEFNDIKDLKQLCTKSGGFVSHIGISDALELIKRAEDGDKNADMVWNTMIYQIIKSIGAMATVLNGEIDGILLSGGMVYSKDLVSKITDACNWISTVTAYPGEFEMEAMASGAMRVLSGEEDVKKYKGEPCWKGFEFEEDVVLI